MANLAYINFIPKAEGEAFARKIIQVAANLKTDPNWLMQVMKTESYLRADIENTKYPFYTNGKLDGYATGLIQFIPSTAKSLGTTTAELKKMTRLQQLVYVEKYFKKLNLVGKLYSYFDIYLSVFFPVAIGKPDSYIFETKYISRSSVAANNPGIDLNKDGKITMAEFKQYVINSVEKTYQDATYGVIKFIEDTIKNNPVKTGIFTGLLALTVGFTLSKII